MSQIILFFFELQTNIKLYHWMTTSFARHNAADKLFDNLLEYSDKFMEVYIGKYGRPSMTKTNIQLQNLNDKNIIKFLDDKSNFLLQELPKHLSASTDTDLLNIRDELLANINQTKYLFTLN